MTQVNISQVVEDVRALNKMFKSMQALGQALEVIGNVEQAEREALARKDRAVKEANAAVAQADKVKADVAAAQAEVVKAQALAKDEVAKAKAEAKQAVADAQTKAELIVAAAKSEVARVEELGVQATGALKAKELELIEVDAKIEKANKMLDQLRAKIQGI